MAGEPEVVQPADQAYVAIKALVTMPGWWATAVDLLAP